MGKRRQQIEGAQFVRYFGPLLDALRTLGSSGTPSEVVEQIAKDLRLSDEAQNELMDSGNPRFANQVAWARFYLIREGLVESSKRGVWSLTEKGRTAKIDPIQARTIFLKLVKVFREERERRKQETPQAEDQLPEDATPAPSNFRDQLLDVLLKLPAEGFERLCQRLLRESGFIQVVVTGRTGDEGIDGYGTLQVNPLVSFKVLFQCKRYRKAVTASQVRDFRGAMDGRTDKGIILTTGSFTADARKEATRDSGKSIELVDAQNLIDMFVKLELGLKPVQAFEVDGTFFDEFKSNG